MTWYNGPLSPDFSEKKTTELWKQNYHKGYPLETSLFPDVTYTSTGENQFVLGRRTDAFSNKNQYSGGMEGYYLKTI